MAPLLSPTPDIDRMLCAALRAAVIDQHPTTTDMPLWDAILQDLASADNPHLVADEWLDSLGFFASIVAGMDSLRGAAAIREQDDEGYSEGGLADLRARLQSFVEGRNLPESLPRSMEAEAATVAEGEVAKNRRDELVRTAMAVKLPRASIAAAAGVTEARLYQIRDGRR